MLILGNKNVARFNGCFGLALSPPISGKDNDFGNGDPAGEAVPRTEGVGAEGEGLGGDTNRLKPMLRRPPIALSVPPTEGG